MARLNSYAGLCLRCRRYVKAGDGYAQRDVYRHRWLVRCKDCVGKGNKPLPIKNGVKSGVSVSDMSDSKG